MDGSKTEGLEMKVSAGTEGARRASGVSADGAAAPDPEVVAKAKRRRFSAEYRLRIVRLADACKAPGELGALLRREGLYSSLLSTWRRQREQGALEVLRARKRGPKPKAVDPRAQQLEQENALLPLKMKQATSILAFQKKMDEILRNPLKPFKSHVHD